MSIADIGIEIFILMKQTPYLSLRSHMLAILLLAFYIYSWFWGIIVTKDAHRFTPKNTKSLFIQIKTLSP